MSNHLSCNHRTPFQAGKFANRRGRSWNSRLWRKVGIPWSPFDRLKSTKFETIQKVLQLVGRAVVDLKYLSEVMWKSSLFARTSWVSSFFAFLKNKSGIQISFSSVGDKAIDVAFGQSKASRSSVHFLFFSISRKFQKVKNKANPSFE